MDNYIAYYFVVKMQATPDNEKKFVRRNGRLSAWHSCDILITVKCKMRVDT